MSKAVLAMTLMVLTVAAGQPKSQSTPTIGVRLVPSLASPMDGRIAVKNKGTQPAGPTKLILDCQKLGGPLAGPGGCPDLPPSFAPFYFDRAFPKYATVKVPALRPGETFTHRLSFWNETLKWPSGTYYFTAITDAEHTAGPGSEASNKTVGSFTVP